MVTSRAKREQLCTKGLLPESEGQNLALTVFYVPYSLDSGYGGALDVGGDECEHLGVGGRGLDQHRRVHFVQPEHVQHLRAPLTF